MARYKPIDSSPRLLPVDLAAQLLPGTFEHALDQLIDHELDLSGFDERYRNGAAAAAGWPVRCRVRRSKKGAEAP